MRVITILLLFLWMFSHAQVLTKPMPIDQSLTKLTDKDKKGAFKAQKVKGKITGTGLYQFKNGTLYIGDFKDKVFNGLGMIISSDQDSIKNCPNAKFYVGRFKNGLKNGKGVCYDESGNVVYAGKFLEDSPVDSFQSQTYSIKYFSDLQTDDLYYIGEFEGEYPNGFGAIFFPDGDFLVSSFVDGDRSGNSVYIQSDGNWFSENVDGDVITPISSSEEYSALVSASKQAFWSAMKEASGYFAQAVKTGSQAVKIAQGKSIGNSAGGNYTSSYSETPSYPESSNNRSSLPGDKYDLSEQRNYNVDKSTYHKYDGMLSKVFSGNMSASASEIRTWQSEMKRLRQKWESRGKSFPHFPNEDR